jgi:hypothetical protein
VEADAVVRSVQHHEVVGSGIYVAGFIFFIVLWYVSLRLPVAIARDSRLTLVRRSL